MPSPITDAEIDQLFADARAIRLHVCPGCAAVVDADSSSTVAGAVLCAHCAERATVLDGPGGTVILVG